ncbi:hypothetical protein NQZ79_g712 [Umbelopsis isabellina]|nr:hypothetical protein NQZ79_g712 [Umbelopsis isabellina]
MSVVLRSASISLNESSFKKRLSVDRPPTKSLSTEPSPSLKSENTLKAPVQEKAKPILVVVPKATSKRKPLTDITPKICRTLSQSVASCQASPNVLDAADFTIYVDAPAQSRIPKSDASVQENVVVPETDKPTTDQDTLSKENIPPILLLAKDKSEIPMEKSEKPPSKPKKQSSTPDKKQNTIDASVKRKRRQTMDTHTIPKRASLRMMR